jgi:Chaperone of endosialidase
MGLFDKNEPPAPVDPRVAAGAQTASNVSTAVANAYLNAPNQITPLGRLTTTATGSHTFTDPTTGATYEIPEFTQKQTLEPTQAATLNQSELAKLNLATLANTQSNRLNSVLGNGIDLSSAPAAPQLPPKIIDPYDLSMTKPIQFSLGDAGPIATNYDPGGTTQRDRVEAALFERLNPQLALERQRTEQQLADRGIQAGQAAYGAGMDVYTKMATDARLGVVAAGGQEQKLQNDIAAQRAGFQNAAQQQKFNQLQASGQFYNQAEQQAATEQQQRAAFYNAAAREHYFTDPASRRKDALTEMYTLRNQPINEISALLSGSQVQQPTFMETPRTQIPTTDVAGLMNQNFNQQFANFQQQQQQTNQIIGGLFGAAGNIGRGIFAGGGLLASDRKVKENIDRIGTVFVAEERPVEEPRRRKLPIYEYSYKGNPARHVGPMAQDVEKVDPGAVRSIGGIKHIDAPRVMGAIMRAA